MLRRLAGWMVLVAMLVVGVFAPSPAVRAGDACAVCSGAKTIKCPTCAGSGTAAVPCDACGGDGHMRCSDHVTVTDDIKGGWFEFFRFHAGQTRRCPNVGCKKGRVELAKSPCKLCSGSGTSKCPPCSKQCPVCSGRKTRTAVCADCNGAGKLPCLACAAPASACALCAGKTLVRCGPCEGAGEVLDYCASCSGRGQLICVLCDGGGKSACLLCFGSGKNALATLGASGPAPKCPMCDGKGVEACSLCKEGSLICNKCGGTGRRNGPCVRCGGSWSVSCPACGDSAFRTLEVEGLFAAKAGAKADAARLLTRSTEMAAKTAKTAADSAAEARSKAVERINAIDLGAEFDKGVSGLAEAKKALRAYYAAAASAAEAKRVATRIEGELKAASPAPLPPPK